MIKITDKPINVQKVMETASAIDGGALTVYIGKVRSQAHGKNVRWLEYETDEKKAIITIREIVEAATVKFNIKGFGLSHRIGTLKPGEETIALAVSTSNHTTSIEACQCILNDLYTYHPIWQKEVFEDGSEWVSPRPAK